MSTKQINTVLDQNKHERLAMFFVKICVQDKRIAKNKLSPKLEGLIQNGLVRIGLTKAPAWLTCFLENNETIPSQNSG